MLDLISPPPPRLLLTSGTPVTMSDPRFARLHTDPRFVRPKASKTKFVVDDRFKQLFEDQQRASLALELPATVLPS